MKKLLFLGVILILLAAKCQKGVTKDTFNAQKNPIDTILHRNALKEMYATLENLTDSNDSIFSIVHIGDSHVEIGQFSGEIKRQLEKNTGKVKKHGCIRINSSINKVKRYFQSIL